MAVAGESTVRGEWILLPQTEHELEDVWIVVVPVKVHEQQDLTVVAKGHVRSLALKRVIYQKSSMK